VGFGGAGGAHLVEVDVAAEAGGLQGGFGTGEASADDLDALCCVCCQVSGSSQKQITQVWTMRLESSFLRESVAKYPITSPGCTREPNVRDEEIWNVVSPLLKYTGHVQRFLGWTGPVQRVGLCMNFCRNQEARVAELFSGGLASIYFGRMLFALRGEGWDRFVGDAHGAPVHQHLRA
jgi:hypothetical protein